MALLFCWVRPQPMLSHLSRSTHFTLKYACAPSSLFNFQPLPLMCYKHPPCIFYTHKFSQLNPMQHQTEHADPLHGNIMSAENVCELSVCFINSLLGGGIQNIKLETIISLSVSLISKRILKLIKGNLLLCTTGRAEKNVNKFNFHSISSTALWNVSLQERNKNNLYGNYENESPSNFQLHERSVLFKIFYQSPAHTPVLSF